MSRGEPEVVQHRHHGVPGVGELTQDLEHGELIPRVKRRHRLIGQHYVRLHRQHPRHCHSGSLAAGERRDRTVGESSDAGCFHRADYGRAVNRPEIARTRAVRQPTQRDNILHRHWPIEDVSLRQIGNTPRP